MTDEKREMLVAEVMSAGKAVRRAITTMERAKVDYDRAISAERIAEKALENFDLQKEQTK
jgi:orotate phosphoribosyltransferase